MSLKFMRNAKGPELPPGVSDKRFRSYTDAANWANEIHLPDGVYFIRPAHLPVTIANMREVTVNGKSFHVEGLGNI